MSACFYPINFEDKSYLKKINKFRFMNYISLLYNIDSEKIIEIIRHILSKYCDISVIGYDKKYQKIWCKKYNKSICDLHIEIEIIYKDYELSQIKIIPLIGNDLNIKRFVSIISQFLKIYQKHNLLKNYFERCVI